MAIDKINMLQTILADIDSNLTLKMALVPLLASV